MLAVFKAIMCIQMGLFCTPESKPDVFSSIGGMPQIPFEVYHTEYNKTVHVIAGCEASNKAVVLEFYTSETDISTPIFEAVKGAFDKPGITKIKVCRVNS